MTPGGSRNELDGLKVTINVVASHQEPATCTVELVSGPTAPGDIDDFELQHARRVLAQLKAAIGAKGCWSY